MEVKSIILLPFHFKKAYKNGCPPWITNSIIALVEVKNPTRLYLHLFCSKKPDHKAVTKSSLEPVCCKKRQKIVPDQLLVCGVGCKPSLGYLSRPMPSLNQIKDEVNHST